jgi:hypothetical protein
VNPSYGIADMDSYPVPGLVQFNEDRSKNGPEGSQFVLDQRRIPAARRDA